MSWMSTYVLVVISPETTTRPVLTSVSQATRPSGSSFMTASSTPSEIWSATLSGCPSVTDSEVNRNSFSAKLIWRGFPHDCGNEEVNDPRTVAEPLAADCAHAGG